MQACRIKDENTNTAGHEVFAPPRSLMSSEHTLSIVILGIAPWDYYIQFCMSLQALFLGLSCGICLVGVHILRKPVLIDKIKAALRCN